MKKAFCLLPTLYMDLSLAACGNCGNNDGNASDNTNPPQDSGTNKPFDSTAGGVLIPVGTINNDPNKSGYRTANDAAMRATFTEENGYKATFYNNDTVQQIAIAQQMIQDEVDFLLLSFASTTGWDAVLQDTQAADTQIILFDVCWRPPRACMPPPWSG